MRNIKKMRSIDKKRYMNTICSLKSPEMETIGSMLVVEKLQSKYKRLKRYKKSEDILHSLEILKSYKYIELIKCDNPKFPLIRVTDTGMVFREVSSENIKRLVASYMLSVISIIISIISLFTS